MRGSRFAVRGAQRIAVRRTAQHDPRTAHREPRTAQHDPRTAHRQPRTFLTILALLLLFTCKKKTPPPVNLNAQNQVAPRVVKLYFESAALLLTPEQRSVQLPQNPAGAIPIVIRELAKGATNPALARSLPADTVIRGAYLLPDGNAFIDLGGVTLTQGWQAGSHEELMAVYSIVQTVTANFPEAKKVRILVNGTPPETLAGHIALDRPLTPLSDLVDPRAR